MNDNAINMYDEINNGNAIIDYNNNDSDILIIRQQPSLTQYDIDYGPVLKFV
jgi:hypothetical protein